MSYRSMRRVIDQAHTPEPKKAAPAATQKAAPKKKAVRKKR